MAGGAALVAWSFFAYRYYDWEGSPESEPVATSTSSIAQEYLVCHALVGAVNLIGTPGVTLQDLASDESRRAPLERMDQAITDLNIALNESEGSTPQKLSDAARIALNGMHENRIDITYNLSVGDYNAANYRLNEAQTHAQEALDGNCGQ